MRKLKGWCMGHVNEDDLEEAEKLLHGTPSRPQAVTVFPHGSPFCAGLDCGAVPSEGRASLLEAGSEMPALEFFANVL